MPDCMLVKDIHMLSHYCSDVYGVPLLDVEHPEHCGTPDALTRPEKKLTIPR